MPADCPFCHPDDSARILINASNYWYSKLDPYPVSPGHALVISRAHIPDLFTIFDPERLVEAHVALKATAEVVSKMYAPRPVAGWNIGVNEGRAAGRTIDHLHIHLIPRYDGDQPDPRGGIRRILLDPAQDPWLNRSRTQPPGQPRRSPGTGTDADGSPDG